MIWQKNRVLQIMQPNAINKIYVGSISKPVCSKNYRIFQGSLYIYWGLYKNLGNFKIILCSLFERRSLIVDDAQKINLKPVYVFLAFEWLYGQESIVIAKKFGFQFFAGF